jgi:hypothetical protein
MKKQLLFSTMDEFQQYVAENNISISALDIFESNEAVVKEIEETIIHEEIDIELSFLSDSPKVKARIGESNIFYVDNLELNENICMPVKLTILGRSILVNICNENNVAHATLSIALDSEHRYNVLFEVKKKENNNFLLELTRNTIEKSA